MTTTRPPSDLEALEREALEHLEDEVRLDLDVDADAARATDGPEVSDDEAERSPVRVTLAVAFPVIAAAVMVGGVFTGVSPRPYAIVSGLLGVALAFGLRRLRHTVLANTLVVVGLFGIGLAMVVPTGLDNLARLQSLVSQAAASGDVLRPPVEFLTGWKAITGWLMATTGFVAAWIALVVRKPAIALIVPLPIAAVAGISVPEEHQVASGLTVLLLFALGLGLLSSAQAAGQGDEAVPISYEIRKGLKALPVLAVITVGLFLLSQTDFLFPSPYIDPAQEPQRPKTTPLSEVPDRVLFEISDPNGGELEFKGPWRLGSLDVYDGRDWRLPPFSENQLEDVPENGVVDPELFPKRGVRAQFKVAGLGGAVLPGLPNTVGIVAEGPRLAYDSRNGSIRVSSGQIQAGLRYSVVGAALPSVADLREAVVPLPAHVREFVEVPAAPPAVRELLDEANTQFDNQWDRFDSLFNHVRENVVATGVGTPVSITPTRVQEILGETLEASPFEMVATQALLARWAGIPSRIAYGYDGGELVDGVLQVRPKHGASFVEVYFVGYGWLPVIAPPVQAEPTVGSDPSQQQVDPNILPSKDIAVRLFLPLLVPPASVFLKQVQQILLIGLPIVAFLLLAYTAWPALRKAMLRSRRRAAARAEGPRARVALAYAEWRDAAADYGFHHPTDTPFMFLDRFVEDAEHTELAWLTTRVLWGDLQHGASVETAVAAEELSKALRRRLAAAQPATMRAVAAVSRTSIRQPFAPATDLTRKRGEPRRVPEREGATT